MVKSPPVFNPTVSPYPATHSGGMRAVAMANPGMAFVLSARVTEMMPARPPNTAISPSSTVGSVRERISWVKMSRGVKKKYTELVMSAMAMATPKFLRAMVSRLRSLVPTPSPMPRIGFISGEMSMAPMITAPELRLSPRLAIMMEQTSIHALLPRIRRPLTMLSIAPSRSLPSRRSRNSWNHNLIPAFSGRNQVLLFFYRFLFHACGLGKNAVDHLEAAIAHLGELLVMGDDDEALAEIFPQLEQEVVQFLGIRGVKVAARLVGEDNGRFID